jgi:Zn-dependent protease
MNLDLALYFLPGLVIGLTLHEFSHALTAAWLGDRHAASQGRVSLNPIRHLSFWEHWRCSSSDSAGKAGAVNLQLPASRVSADLAGRSCVEFAAVRVSLGLAIWIATVARFSSSLSGQRHAGVLIAADSPLDGAESGRVIPGMKPVPGQCPDRDGLSIF